MELIFEVRNTEEGGYSARALGHAIFTQADTWEDLRANVLEATALHFEDETIRPRLVQLHSCAARPKPSNLELECPQTLPRQPD